MRRLFAVLGAAALALAGIVAPAEATAPAPAAVAELRKPVAQVGEYVTKTLADGSKTRVPTAATEKAAAAAKRQGADMQRATTVCPGLPAVCFHYARGIRNLTGTTNTGSTVMNGITSQHKPVRSSTSPSNVVYHTLWETAAIDNFSAGGRNIVEVGWNVDFAVNGDENPHLFVYHWVNNTTSCYNGCGWVDNPNEAVNAGTSLAYTASGSAPSIYYQYRIERVSSRPAWCTGATCTAAWAAGDGGWQIGQKNQGAADRPVGGFPDAVWTAGGTSFTAAPEYRMFWEVASQHVETCGDMGSGAFGSSTLPHSSADLLAASNGYGTADWDVVQVDPAADTPTAFRVFDGAGYATPDTDRIRGGGPGYNLAGTGTGSIGSC